MNSWLFLHPIIIALLALAGSTALLAVVSPRLFHTVCRHTSSWVDTSRALSFLDTRVDIDHYFLPYCRILGGLVMGAVILFGFLIMRYG